MLALTTKNRIMSEPTDTPGVKKTTRRFAPVKRGGKSPAAQRRAAAAAAAEAESSSVKQEASESSNTAAAGTSTESSTTAEGGNATAKSTPIGTIRPEGSGSGRLQSVNDGQKTRGGTMKVCFFLTFRYHLLTNIVIY